MAKYASYSLYNETPKKPDYLDIWVPRVIPADPDDYDYQIQPQYTYRQLTTKKETGKNVLHEFYNLSLDLYYVLSDLINDIHEKTLCHNDNFINLKQLYASLIREIENTKYNV